MFRARPKSSVRLKSRPKSKTTRPITHHDPGNSSPRSATPHRHANRARPKRASRESKPRGRATVRVPADAPSEPGERPASGREFHRPNLSARPRRPTVNPSDPDRSDSATTRLSGRSSRTTVPTPRCMTRRSNKDNLVEHPEIDKLEKQLRKQKPKRWPTKQLALTPLKWRALKKKEEIHLLLLLIHKTLLEM
ncbi:unnamed protein product [Microthlaspi erraticum]|uniref:Uncharacterized protein n=1 Tax=Microthlaspi erraticum TaxID=1685480 RepID=A0A6D2JLD2_9BRAS|nr:unnamed protein product [Microthlaspi erraticum]